MSLPRPLPIHQSSTGSGVTLRAHQTIKVMNASATTVAIPSSIMSHLRVQVAELVLDLASVLFGVMPLHLLMPVLVARTRVDDDKQDKARPEDSGHHIGAVRIEPEHPHQDGEGHGGPHDTLTEVDGRYIHSARKRQQEDDHGDESSSDIHDYSFLGEGWEGASFCTATAAYCFNYSTSAIFCQYYIAIYGVSG